MRKTPLKKASKSYAKALKAYREHTKPMWLEQHPRCQFKVYVKGYCDAVFVPAPFSDDMDCSCIPFECQRKHNVTVHHKMGRGKYLNDMRCFMTVCEEHHDWIETYKKQARKLGYILYK